MNRLFLKAGSILSILGVLAGTLVAGVCDDLTDDKCTKLEKCVKDKKVGDCIDVSMPGESGTIESLKITKIYDVDKCFDQPPKTTIDHKCKRDTDNETSCYDATAHSANGCTAGSSLGTSVTVNTDHICTGSTACGTNPM